MNPLWRTSLGLVSLAATLLAAGCGAGAPSTVSDPVNLRLSGSVFGGQQPVIGSTIQLYTVGTSTNGAASTTLIGSTVTSGAGGNFSITGDYNCSNATQVYIVAKGGNSGAGVNSEITLATALGSCSSLTPNTFILINELSTVAAAYALAPFEGSAYTSIGASSASTTGLTNAFNTAALLTSAAAPAGITVPTAELNTLANILASCVNSAGASSTGCSQLNSATSTTNTFDAAFYIAKHPASNTVLGLYTLSSATAPFQPSLSASSAPQDFTVAVRYTGSTATPLSTPYGIAIGAAGNVFVTNQTGNNVVAMSPLSTSFTTGRASTGLSSPQGIAVDTLGYLWIDNPGAHNVERYGTLESVGGSPASFGSVSATPITGFGLTANPVAIATDTYGGAYTVSPSENKVYTINAGSSAVTGSLANSSFATPAAIALSNPDTIAVGTGAGQICTFTYFIFGGTTPSFGTPACATQGNTISISGLSYNTNQSAVGYAGTESFLFGSVAPGYYPTATGSDIYISPSQNVSPSGLAFDGSGNAFILDYNVIAEYNGTTNISGGNGYGALNTPQGIAVDPSGNVWTTNSGDNSVSIFVGLAAPTLTPIAANLH